MAFPSGLSVPTHLHREGEEVERRRRRHSTESTQQPRWTESTDRQTLREWTERENETLAGQMGRGVRESRLKEQRYGLGKGHHPIMHFKTGHSNSMQRAGNLPECEASPRPRADKAKPAACGHSNLDAVLLGSCL